MTSSPAPLVSVVIPVYNGERFLADAIRSVLAQTHSRFDLTILNNCSTDRTPAIAQEFVDQDSRVRLLHNTELLSVVANHNKAFTVISDEAQYAKILGADDWLYPMCLEEMVRVAERFPTVGMVTSYVLAGAWVAWDGLPYPSTFLSGRDVCRLRLLRNIKVFGGPSASLIRARLVREKRPFYDPLDYHGDTKAYLELLQHHDFGYVHQVLSYKRKGDDSRTTSYLQRVQSYPAHDILEVLRFGPVYLTPDERAARLRDVTRTYYRFLARSVLEFRGREFWEYHLRQVRELGYAVSYPRLALAVVGRIADILLNPKRTIEGVIRRLGAVGRRAGRPAVVAPPKPLTR